MADPTSRDFMDWRTRYSAPPLRQNMLNSQDQSAGVLEAINNMPYVFDARKFIGLNQGQIAQAVNPNKMSPAAAAQLAATNAAQAPAAPAPAPAPTADPQGLLQMLGLPAEALPLLQQALNTRGGAV
jgi:hypothetical protein